jgi:indolepyruvate ferredoxin oxidoreductase beta subunit
MKEVNNVLIVGLGGQGVILASDVISLAAFKSGYDIKKSEVHGMSQRGGSVTTHIRFGKKIYSPLIKRREADFIVALKNTEIDRVRDFLSDDGKVINVPEGLLDKLENKKTLNISMIGILSKHLDIPNKIWEEVIKERVPTKFQKINLEAFKIGKEIKL